MALMVRPEPRHSALGWSGSRKSEGPGASHHLGRAPSREGAGGATREAGGIGPRKRDP